MFKINKNMVQHFNKEQRMNAEYMYLSLAYAYENESEASGSRKMSLSTEKKVMRKLSGDYSFAERLLMSSYKELFKVSKEIREEHGVSLIGFVDNQEKTPENALIAWRIIYKEMEENKKKQKTA